MSFYNPLLACLFTWLVFLFAAPEDACGATPTPHEVTLVLGL
jgi:hypothetical protein